MNNSPIIYNEECIWTSMEFISLLNKLLIESIDIDNLEVQSNYKNKLKNSLSLDFEELINDESDLDIFKNAFGRLKTSLSEPKNGYNSNEFAHKIYALLKSASDKKALSDLVMKIPNGKGTKFMELVDSCIRLLNNKPIFETLKSLSLDQLIGEWISIKSDGPPDYDINFNMTDFSPSYSEIKILFTQDSNCTIKIPVRDYTNPKTSELTIISGSCTLKEGIIIITQKEWVKKIFVLDMEVDELKTNLFKTNITFKRTTR